MEISPIAGIRALPVVKAPPIDPKLTAVFDIDSSARIGDETWAPTDGQSGPGSEDDGSEDNGSDEAEDFGEPEAETRASASEEKSEAGQISFFA
jgi:hypothetical protein